MAYRRHGTCLEAQRFNGNVPARSCRHTRISPTVPLIYGVQMSANILSWYGSLIGAKTRSNAVVLRLIAGTWTIQNTIRPTASYNFDCGVLILVFRAGLGGPTRWR